MLFARTRTNPVFYARDLRGYLAGEPDRLDRVFTEPDNVDFLTWNLFQSLETHTDPAWLGHRLELLGGSQMRSPVRISLWTGRERPPLLTPSPAYRSFIRERVGGDGDHPERLAAFVEPVEVPVRIETPDVLTLVETTVGNLPLGAGGRDRILELIDAGLEHARRLSKTLAIAVVYTSGNPAAVELSSRINHLREEASLRRALPFRSSLAPVVLRDLSWQQLIRTWQTELDYLRLGGQPVRAFLDHCSAQGLR